MQLFSGTSNPELAKKISAGISTPLSDISIKSFADGESYVEITNTTRGHDVVIIQSISKPVNDNLMDTFVLVDALKRNGAKRITLCAPYLGYSRQDRRANDKRSPISAKMVADLLQAVGVRQLITVDIHNPAIEGFYNIPFLNAFTSDLFAHDIKQNEKLGELKNSVIVSPDAGGVTRARAVAKKLGLDVAIVDKRREEANKIEEMRLIGDVAGKNAILIDDIADTCGTLVKCSDLLYEKGAKTVVAYITHGIFSKNALENIKNSKLAELVVTDSIVNADADKIEKIRRVSVTPLMIDAIRRTEG